MEYRIKTVHSKAKGFKCKIWNKTFACKRYLTKHLNTALHNTPVILDNEIFFYKPRGVVLQSLAARYSDEMGREYEFYFIKNIFNTFPSQPIHSDRD